MPSALMCILLMRILASSQGVGPRVFGASAYRDSVTRVQTRSSACDDSWVVAVFGRLQSLHLRGFQNSA